MDVLQTIKDAGFSVSLRSFSALDSFFAKAGPSVQDTSAALPFVFVETSASITDLARLFEDIRFPGLDLADAVLDSDSAAYYFRCPDGDEARDEDHAFVLKPALSAASKLSIHPSAPRWQAALKGGVIVSRYNTEGLSAREIAHLPIRGEPNTEMQRLALSCILLSKHPERGLELLKASAFVDKFWPCLAALDDIAQSKEFHPEGNGWRHSLETLRYRKPGSGGAYNLTLSLALLLHDTGKVLAARSGKKRFDHHAEIGAVTAERFLRGLGFKDSIIEDVYYLVRNHMMPAALPRLPIDKNPKVKAVVNDPRFPVLMELYRCDESSSFKGLEGYYASAGTYRSYVKKRGKFRSLLL
jgi:poly(A) polymerase